MDHKAWPWKKKSTEKTIIETDKPFNLSLEVNEEEIQKLLVDKAELEDSLKDLNSRLSSVLAECNAKDGLVKKHESMAQEAIASWEQTKAETVSLQLKLDEALRERVVGEERSTHLDTALKECMQQLRFVREEQEKRIHDAVMKTSKEYEKDQAILEEKLAETSKRLAETDAKNTHLSKVLLTKNKIIDELNRQRTQAEADFSTLMTRLEAKEKDNASLKYETQVLERELEIRNEEREFNRRTAEAAHKQHLENVKKIAKMESECQRLRLLVRKRLPGPAALAKMKNEVEMLGRDPIETRRRKLTASPSGIDSERINNLTEHLHLMEEENKTLREALNKKINELQFSRNMYARTASKLLELEESSKGLTNIEPGRSSSVSHEISLASISDIDNDDKASCADSWASALISELGHFKNKKMKGPSSIKTVEASEMSLMDDFAEMEKLAVVSVDNPPGTPPVPSHEANAVVGPTDIGSNANSLEETGKEIIPVSDYRSPVNVPGLDIKLELIDKVPRWLQDVIEVILNHKHVAERGADEILKDIRHVLSYIGLPVNNHFADVRKGPQHEAENSIQEDATTGETHNQNLSSELCKSVRRITELVEGISLQSPAYGVSETFPPKDERSLSYNNSETPSGYTVRVLQWKTSEMREVLQQFLHTCYDLLDDKADINKFAKELSSALDWIVNHCFSLQDVSSMREEIKKQFDWDESRSESEAEVGVIGQVSEADEYLPKERLSYLSTVVASNCHNDLFQGEDVLTNLRVENIKVTDGVSDKEAAKKDPEGRLHLGVDKGDSKGNRLQESDKSIANLQKELETLKNSTGLVNRNSGSKGFDRQLSESEVESNDAPRKSISRDSSITKQEEPRNEPKQEEKQQIRTEWEITAATEKLAECQETILHLGKQLKAMAKESTRLDKAASNPTEEPDTAITITTANPANVSTTKKLSGQRSSLLDQMMAEDDAQESKGAKTRETKGKESNTGSTFITETIEALEQILLSDVGKSRGNGASENSFAIVPRKKEGIKGLWKKLLWRKKTGSSKKLPLPFAS